MKNFFSFGVASVLAVTLTFLTACSDDDDKELRFPSDAYVATIGNTLNVHPSSGNGKYSAYPVDETVVTAGYHPSGYITLTGLKEGVTDVRVVDEATNQEKILKVYVTLPYCTFFGGDPQTVIEPEKGDFDGLEKNLQNEYPFGGESYMYHLMRGSDIVYIHTNVLYEGKYSLVKEGDGYLLTIGFEKDGDSIEKLYRIANEPEYGNGFKLFEEFFTEAALSARSVVTRETPVGEEFIVYYEDLTQKYIDQYPDLEYAGLKYVPQINFNTWLNPAILEKFEN